MSEVQKYHRGIWRVLPHPICLISSSYGGAVSSSLLGLMVTFTPVFTVEFGLVSGLPYYVKWDFTEEKSLFNKWPNNLEKPVVKL